MTDRPKFDLHAEVTNRIVRAIEDGPGEFVMPWHRAAATGTPTNAVTKRAYRGINVVSLWITAVTAGYGTSLWATFKQWKERGCSVRKGEKETLIVFYKMLDRNTPDEGDEESELRAGKLMIAKPSWVFNASQVDGFEGAEPAPRPNTVIELIGKAEAAIKATGADIRHGGSRALYQRVSDFIQVPQARDFVGSPTSTPQESYYSTVFHELAHWTGAEARLDREKGKRFSDKPYAFEELIAELSAAYTCAELGIASDPRPDHAQYIASWLEVLKNDKRAIFTAAAAASAATDYLLSFSREHAIEEGA